MAAGIGLLSSPSIASYFGLASGRTTPINTSTLISVELGQSRGDFFSLDYEHTGLRFNLSLSSNVILLADIGRTTLGDAKGDSFGAGLLYQSRFDRIALAPNPAIKISYHAASVKLDGFSDYQPDVISLEALLGGHSGFLGFSGVGWFANAGVHHFSDRLGSETELGIGGGLLTPVFNGEGYLGVDFIDEPQVSAGYRWLVN